MASKKVLDDFKKKAQLNDVKVSDQSKIVAVKDGCRINVIYTVLEVQLIDTMYGTRVVLSLQDPTDKKDFKVWAFPRLAKLFATSSKEDDVVHLIADGTPKQIMFEAIAPRYTFYTL